MTISEKSAYLKGLADGMNLDKTTTEGKLIAELIDLVDDLAQTVESIDSEVVELGDFVDEIDSDLADCEEYLDEADKMLPPPPPPFDDEDEDDFECDGECEGCDGCDDIFDVDEEGMRCIMCENCGDTICFDESLNPEDIICPSCGEHVIGAEATEDISD